MTYMCSKLSQERKPRNKRTSPEEDYSRICKVLAGSMNEHTMYVIPFLIRRVGSPLNKVGIGITDSIYAVLNMQLTGHIDASALERCDTESEFTGYPRQFTYGSILNSWEPYEPVFQDITKGWQQQAAISVERFASAMNFAHTLVTERAKQFFLWHFGARQNVELLADEASQNFWLSMLKDGTGFDNYDGIRPAHRVCSLALRRHCNRIGMRPSHEVLLSPDDLVIARDDNDTRTVTRPSAMSTEVLDRVNSEFDRLTPDQRDVLRCMYWDKLKLVAISEKLGIPKGTLYSRATRAREDLRQGLADIATFLARFFRPRAMDM
jgi:RNA polymerase sigma factor (sigma-70 family)